MEKEWISEGEKMERMNERKNGEDEEWGKEKDGGKNEWAKEK